jgi:hypothetical protein
MNEKRRTLGNGTAANGMTINVGIELRGRDAIEFERHLADRASRFIGARIRANKL